VAGLAGNAPGGAGAVSSRAPPPPLPGGNPLFAPTLQRGSVERALRVRSADWTPERPHLLPRGSVGARGRSRGGFQPGTAAPRCQAGTLFSLPRSSVGVSSGRSASGRPTGRRSARTCSHAGAWEPEDGAGAVSSRAPPPPAARREPSFRSHAPAWECRAGAPRPVGRLDAGAPALAPTRERGSQRTVSGSAGRRTAAALLVPPPERHCR